MAAQKEAERRAFDRTDQEIIKKSIEDGISTVWERFAEQQPQCGLIRVHQSGEEHPHY